MTLYKRLNFVCLSGEPACRIAVHCALILVPITEQLLLKAGNLVARPFVFSLRRIDRFKLLDQRSRNVLCRPQSTLLNVSPAAGAFTVNSPCVAARHGDKAIAVSRFN